MLCCSLRTGRSSESGLFIDVEDIGLNNYQTRLMCQCTIIAKVRLASERKSVNQPISKAFYDYSSWRQSTQWQICVHGVGRPGGNQFRRTIQWKKSSFVCGTWCFYTNLGVDTVACLAVNDVFVVDAWAKTQNAEHLLMLADGSADYVNALGLTLDLTARGLGIRADRFAMVVDNGVVTHLAREEPGKMDVSSAESILKVL